MATQAEIVNTATTIAKLAETLSDAPTARPALLREVDKLRFLVEEPMDVIMRQFGNMNTIAAMRVLVSTGVLQAILADGSTASAKELAATTGLEESVIIRAMRLIQIQGIAEECQPNVYKHNAKSLALIQGAIGHFMYMFSDYQQAFTKLPEYFATHTAEEVRDLNKNPFAFGLGMDGLSYYDVISAEPKRLEAFNATLGQMDVQLPIRGMFPWSSMKEQVESDVTRPFIVDVGGGLGKVLMSIQEEAPAGFGAPMILQDRPDVLNSIANEDIPNITKMPHDFVQPQPVKKAHLYLLRRILHDFYDDVCVTLVKNIASAMAPDSRLLIGDFIVPDQTHVGDDATVYWMDFTMMLLTGREKTAEQFKSILDEAGLQLVKIWRSAIGPQAVIEARLK